MDNTGHLAGENSATTVYVSLLFESDLTWSNLNWQVILCNSELLNKNQVHVCVLVCVTSERVTAGWHAVVTGHLNGIVQLSQSKLAIRHRPAEGGSAIGQRHTTLIWDVCTGI